MPTRRPSQPQVISISTMTFVKLLLVLLGLWLLWFIRDIIAIVFAAVLLAALIDPFAAWLNKRGFPRGLGVIVIYLILAAILVSIVLLLVPALIEQVMAVSVNFSDSYSGLMESVGRFQTVTAEYGLAENVNSAIISIQEAVSASFVNIFSTVRGFIGGLAAFFIILVLAFYMVVEEDVAKKFFKSFLPQEYQPYVAQLFNKMHKKMGAWLRGQIILGLIVGIAVYIGLRILGVQYALLLAIIAGLFEIVPYVGPVVSVIPAAVIGFGMGPITGFAVLILYLIIQQLENNILVPKIMQKVTGLNPVISIIALLIGIKLGGVMGAVLAIPVATMAAVVLEDLFKDVI